MCDGMVPVNKFRSRPSKLSDDSDPIQVGIVPAKIFILKSKRCNDVELQSVDGIEPMITLLLTSNLFNSDNEP